LRAFPVTLGTVDDLPPVVRILRDGLKVVDMATADPWGPDRSMSVGDARDQMRDRNFDLAPLLPRPVTRYVELTTLDRIPGDLPVAEAAQIIDATRLVSSDSSLFDAIGALREGRSYFVIDRGGIGAIVTPSDLQKASVGIAVLGLILGCEASMNTLIERTLGVDWLAYLATNRRVALNRFFEARREHNDEIGLLECLSLGDRLRLVSRSESLQAELGFTSTEFETWSSRIRSVRNALAHAGNILEAEGESSSAIDFFDRLLRFVARLWALARRP
jgi:hypothetical protein